MTDEHAPEEHGPADEAAHLLRRAATLASQGRVAEAAALQRQITTLLEAAATPAAVQHALESIPPDRGSPTREVVIDALNDLGVPSSPREIADYAQARFGVRLEPRLFASLRRDEQRGWKSTRSHRPVYVVPALAVAAPSRLLAMRGKLALSDWPLERRLVGPWSERVDHLTATVNLARQLAWLRTAKPSEAERVAALVTRYAATVPGALDETAAPDPDRVERAARSELDLLAKRNQDWRTEAAAAARKLLAPDQLLWGVPLPEALEPVG